MEYQHISHALPLCGGRIKGRDGAARMLELNPSTHYFRMKKLGITLRDGNEPISSCWSAHEPFCQTPSSGRTEIRPWRVIETFYKEMT
jgi:hypothetical protein